jgi:hypothetical protein
MKTKPLFLLAAIGLTALSLAGCASVQSGGGQANIAMLNGQVTKKDFPAIKKKVKQFTAGDLRKLLRNYRTIKYVSFGIGKKTQAVSRVKLPLGLTKDNFNDFKGVLRLAPGASPNPAKDETIKNARLYWLKISYLGRTDELGEGFYYLPPANFSNDKDLALLVNFILKNNTAVINNINDVGRHHETALYIAAAMGMPHVTWVLLHIGKANPAIWAYQASNEKVPHLPGSRCCMTFTAMAGGTWGNNCLYPNKIQRGGYNGINTGEKDMSSNFWIYRLPQRAYPYQAFMRFNYIFNKGGLIGDYSPKPFTPFEKVVLKELENGTAKSPDICGAVLNEN